MENMNLYNEDAIKILTGMEEESVDLCISDVPYLISGAGGGISCSGQENINIEEKRVYEYNKEINRIVKRGTKHIDLGGVFSDKSEFTRKGMLFEHNNIKFNEWLPLLYRVMKPTTHTYLMINGRNLCKLQTEAEKVGFQFQQLLVWEKNNTTPNKYYLNQCEFILMLRKGNAKNINNLGYSNILRVPNINRKKLHPTEKPVPLMQIMIKNSSNEGEVVLDPFMGSGSTGIASKILNRKFIGIEIDKKYFDIAEDRILNEYKQQNLF